MRILIAEDNAVLADAMTRSLRLSGYAADWVQTGLEAESALEANEFDLVILTGLDGVSDRVKGLDAVADDYLAKPFDLAELEARVRALARRGMSGGPTLIKHGALAYDQMGRVARLNGGAVDLSARELSLPEVFLQRVGRLVSKEQSTISVSGVRRSRPTPSRSAYTGCVASWSRVG